MVEQRKSAGTAGSGVRTRGSQSKLAISALRPLERGPALVEQVVERLRGAILSGELASGSELPPEGKLATSIGVSYVVIREAMRVLRSQGLVEVSQGRRPRVKPAGPDAVRESLDAMLRRSDRSFLELTEFRRPMECEIASLAAERATPESIERLQQAIEEQLAAKTFDQQIDADMHFHDLLAEAAGNSLFSVMLATVASLLRESRRKTIVRVGSGHAVNGHQEMLEAIRRRDSEAARRAMEKHMDRILEDLGE